MANQTQITPSATLNDNLSTKKASSLWDKATVSTTEYNATTIVTQVFSSKSFSKPIDLESSTTFGDSSQQLTPVFRSTANSADVVKPTTRALKSSNDLSYSYVDNLSTKNFDSLSTALKTASDEITSSFTTPLQTSTDVINDTPTEIFTASGETASVSSATRTASVIQTDTFELLPYSTYFPSVSLETSIKSASLKFQTSFTAAKPKQTISPTQSSGISSVYPTGTMTIDTSENNSSVVSYDVPNSTITTENIPTPKITLTTIITTTELTSSRSTSSTQPSTKSTINTTNPATTTTKPATTKTKSTSPTTKQNTLKPSTPTPTPTPTTVKLAPSRKPTLTSTMTKTTVRINTTQPTRSNGSNVKASKLKDLESEVQQLKVGVGVLSASLILLLAAIIIYCIVKRRRKLVKFRRDYGIDDPIMERKPVKLNRESLNWDRVAISNRLAINDGSTEKDRFPMATFAISKGLNSVTEIDDVFKDTRMSSAFDDDVEEADHKSTNSYEIVTNGRTASDNEI